MSEQETARLPIAAFKGVLPLMGIEIPCYVLDTGQRVIGRTSAAEMLSGIKGGGGLEKYLGVAAIKPFIPEDLFLERLVAFRLLEVEGLGKAVKGLEADAMIDLCQGLVAALDVNSRDQLPEGVPRMTDRQKQFAVRASMFLSACAKSGLDALIDEVTGYQYERDDDALRVKLQAYLVQEMRRWEKTYPDQLWIEFARLTQRTGDFRKRPKFWGKLVMELIYDYLDPDVSEWLKTNAPAPKGGKSYHRWLSEQYGLRKLIEHIWMVIGIAKTCTSMMELRRKMAEMYGRIPVQVMMFVPAYVAPSASGPATKTNEEGKE